MNVPEAGICCPRLPQEIDCLIHMAEEKMAGTQPPIRVGDIRVVWIEPDGFFYVGDRRLWLAQKHHRQTKLMKGSGVIVVEADRCLVLDPRFGQSVLKSAEDPQREVRHRAPWVALDGLKEQQFGTRLILLNRIAPSVS